MPFIGKDWRAPGETWVRVSHTSGWERSKLRPIQLLPCTGSNSLFDTLPGLDVDTLLSSSLPSTGPIVAEKMSFKVRSIEAAGARHVAPLYHDSSCASIISNEENGWNVSLTPSSSFSSSCISLTATPSVGQADSEELAIPADDEDVSHSNEPWTPHCFVKTTRSKEFIGCTSMSEAFHLLDLARAVTDVRRFNYICKVVQILVQEKLQNLSATARKHLFAIIQSIVVHSVDQDVHVTTARDILNGFSNGLEEGHVCGSPQLVSKQLDTVSGLMDMFAERKPTTLCDSSEDSLTFLDLPRELLSKIVCCLPDHVSILETAKAHEALDALIERETRVWRSLCQFHFTQPQIAKHRINDELTWRQVFFQLKKYYGLREVYADLIHICCHCKALFWKDHGHPCVAKEMAPSVRVTPRQFVDMLLFL